MYGILGNLLPENQPYATQYLMDIWITTAEFTYAIKDDEGPHFASWTFEAFETAKEKRLKRRLKRIRYNIDSAETLYLVTGRGRIEKVSHHSLCMYTFAYGMWSESLHSHFSTPREAPGAVSIGKAHSF